MWVKRRFRHLDRRAHGAQASEDRVVHRCRHLAGDGLRGGQRFCVVQDGAARNARRVEALQPVGAWRGGRDAVDQGREFDTVPHAQGVGGESRVGRPFGMPKHGREPGEVAVVGGADREVTIGALKCLVRRRQPMGRSDGAGHCSGGRVVGHLPHRHGQSGIHQRGVDVLTASRLRAVM